jgi:hypothetical protein
MKANRIEALTAIWILFWLFVVGWTIIYHPEWWMWIFTFKG